MGLVTWPPWPCSHTFYHSWDEGIQRWMNCMELMAPKKKTVGTYFSSQELGTGYSMLYPHWVFWCGNKVVRPAFIFIQPAALLYKRKGITFGLMRKKSTKHARTWQLLQAGSLSVSFSEQPDHQGMDCKPSKSKDRVCDRCPRWLAMHWLHPLEQGPSTYNPDFSKAILENLWECRHLLSPCLATAGVLKYREFTKTWNEMIRFFSACAP